MKRFLLLIIMIISALSMSAQKVDTIYNIGDGKIVIIDKRPRTVINRPNPITKELKAEPVNIYIQQPDYQHYYPDNIENGLKSESNLIAATFIVVILLLLFGIVGYLIYIANRRSEYPYSNYNCNYDHKPQSPVINHFHVNGGNALIDSSESMAYVDNTNESLHHHRYNNPLISKKEEKSGGFSE